MAAEYTPTPWESAADDLLSIMYNDPANRDRIVYELNVKAAHMPSLKHRRLFEGIMLCVANGEVIHDTTILDKFGTVIPLQWLSYVATLKDTTRYGAMEANAALVRRHGLNKGLRDLLKLADDELASGNGHDNVTPRLMTALSMLGGDSKIERETAVEMALDFAELMESEAPELLMTGLPWLDRLTGGIDLGHMWWIAAPYKSRKSTVMLNIALGLLMMWFTRGCAGDPPSIGIASGEMPRNRISAQLVAMLAAAFIRRRGQWNDTFTAGNLSIPLHQISAKQLMNARAHYRQWDPRRVAAVDYGIGQYSQFKKALRVYDRSRDGGGIVDFKKLLAVIRRDKHLYGTNVFFVDYLQLFKGADSKLFDFVSAASLELQQYAQSENVTLVVLAQQNEDSIKNGTGYSAGIKGGGDPTATADYLIASRYKTDDLAQDGTELELTLKFSRHGVGGSDTKKPEIIHPASGLLLASEWIGRI